MEVGLSLRGGENMKKNIKNNTCIDLSGKVAVIVGGTGSIGEEIALGFLISQATVVVAGRSKETISSRLNQLLKNPQKIVYEKANVLSENSVKKFYNVVMERYGKIDIVVLTHGIQLRKSFVDIDIKEWKKIIDINLTGTFLICKYFTDSMIKRKQGKIIGISSLTSEFGIRDVAAYAASKGGMSMFLKTIAVELAKYNINVNMVAPGRIETAMTKNILKNKEIKLSNLERIPLGRIGIPSDVVGATLFLSSDFSNYITGQTIVVDGGWSASIGNVRR